MIYKSICDKWPSRIEAEQPSGRIASDDGEAKSWANNIVIAIDAQIPGGDWTSLRTKKLFFLPDVVVAFRDRQNPISLAELTDMSPKPKDYGESYSIAVVRDACNGAPITFKKAHAIANGFNSLEGRRTDLIVGALFLLKDHSELFSEKALEDRGLVEIANQLPLKDKTIENIKKGGRMTSYAANIFLTGMQAAYREKHATSDSVSERVKAFVHCEDLRTYVTSSPRAGFQEVLKDEEDEYLVNAADLLTPPADWSDFSG